MRVLWITNIVFPEAQSLLNGESLLKSSGGWMIGAAEALVADLDVDLYVASVTPLVKNLTRIEGKKIKYFLLPYGKGNTLVNHEYEPLWQNINESIHPDVVHIHGTEFSHGLAFIKACGSRNVCVSIQGLVSNIYHYYYSGLKHSLIFKSQTPRSLLFGGIYKDSINFKKRGEIEKETIRSVRHIIGRTSWDFVHTWAINPARQYYYGGEILREEFYEGHVWLYEKCTQHCIFLSQASYPLKGLHILLKAMPFIMQAYPDTTIRIAGSDITRTDTWKEKLLLSDYGNIIRKMIKKFNLQHCISFTGPLDAIGMRREYLNCNIFVCPSSIENSPNSLGEAQILGVPVVASNVGGIPDMMLGDEENLYRFDDVEMLAHKICQIFAKKEQIDTTTMRLKAIERHNPHTIIQGLIRTYTNVAHL